MSLALAAGYFHVLPLKEKVPFLVMADASSGTATIAKLDEDFRHRAISTSEAINRSNVAHFVTMRESYDVEMMNLRDWRAVHSMSSPAVGADYSSLHARTNPRSPYNEHGPARAIRVRILSITFIGAVADGTPRGATVRFQRSLYDKSSRAERPLDSRIATLEFTYNLNLKLAERDRIANPLGFQVTHYQVDNDFSTPLEQGGSDALAAGFDTAGSAGMLVGGVGDASDAVAAGPVTMATPPASPAAPATEPSP